MDRRTDGVTALAFGEAGKNLSQFPSSLMCQFWLKLVILEDLWYIHVIKFNDLKFKILSITSRFLVVHLMLTLSWWWQKGGWFNHCHWLEHCLYFKFHQENSPSPHTGESSLFIGEWWSQILRVVTPQNYIPTINYSPDYAPLNSGNFGH